MYTAYGSIKLGIKICILLVICGNLELGVFNFQFLIQLILSKLIDAGQLQTSWVGYCGWIHLGNLCGGLETLWRSGSPFIISFIIIVVISFICRLVWRWVVWGLVFCGCWIVNI